MSEPSIWHRRLALDDERRKFMREAMKEFDKGWHARRAALQAECPHEHETFSHVGPLGDPWFVCGACGKMRVELAAALALVILRRKCDERSIPTG